MNPFAIIPAPLPHDHVEAMLSKALENAVDITSACGDSGCCGWEREYDMGAAFAILRRSGYMLTGAPFPDRLLLTALENNYSESISDDGTCMEIYFELPQWNRLLAELAQAGVYVALVN